MHASSTILVVDDEPLVRDVACAILKRHGYRVLTVASGKAAVAAMRENGAEIDLILLDPGITVPEPRLLVRSLLAMNPDTVIVISSGYLCEYSLLQFDPGSIAGYVQKPYTAARLRDGVGSVLRSWRTAA